ncbi:MAG: hypothetical protein K8R46_06535, partial [Pirellulales bacterium]|nr:hypothetical protein [Pirellulales bacterium]
MADYSPLFSGNCSSFSNSPPSSDNAPHQSGLIRFLFLLLISLIPLLFASVTHSQTHVSGNISGTWDPAGNPWIVDSACVVPSGQTLTILPGCEIIIDCWESLYIRIDGNLNASGTEPDSILVTAPNANNDHICFELTSGADLHLHYFCYDPDDPGALIQGCEGQGSFSMSHVEAPLGEVNIYRDGLQLQDLHLRELQLEGANNTVSHTVCQQNLQLITGWGDPGAIEYSSADNIFLQRGVFELQSTTSESTSARSCTVSMDSCTVNLLLDLDADMGSLNLTATNCQFHDIETIWSVDMDLTNTTFNEYSEWMGGGGQAIFQSCTGVYIHVGDLSELTLIDSRIDDEIHLQDDVFLTITGSEINKIHGWTLTGVITIQDSQLNGLYANTSSSAPGPAQLNIDHCLFLLNSEDDEISIGRQVAILQNNTFFDRRPGVQSLIEIEGESEIVMQNNVTQGGRYVFEVDPESTVETDFNIYADYYILEQGDLYVTPGADDILQSERVAYTRGETFAHPLPGSPAIDSGTDIFGPDPDGSPPDRGAIPYDHNQDYPPYIVTEEAVEIYWSQDLHLPLLILDDQSAEIILADAPGWLDLDTASDPDTTFLVGVVPQDTDSTTILLLGEDGVNTADSLFMELQVLPYTIIGGEMSGLLSVANSPYYLNRDLIIP